MNGETRWPPQQHPAQAPCPSQIAVRVGGADNRGRTDTGGVLITTEICEDCCGCSWNTNDLRGARIVSDASYWSFCVVPSNNAAECTERQSVISEDYLEGVVDGSN
jgi:hypothetical protein